MFHIFKRTEKCSMWQVYQTLGIHTDLHCHLIPGIDDGCKTLEESQTLLHQLSTVGIKHTYITPHSMGDRYINPKEKIVHHFQLLETNNQTTIQLHPGTEYYADFHFFYTLQTANQVIPLAEKYLLFEVSYLNPPEYLDQIVFEIQRQKYIPLLAHPERYSYWKEKNWEMLKAKGVLFQVNALSFTGHYGPEVQRKAFKLLETSMADFLGSDLHHAGHFDKLNTPNVQHHKAITNYTLFKNNTLTA